MGMGTGTAAAAFGMHPEGARHAGARSADRRRSRALQSWGPAGTDGDWQPQDVLLHVVLLLML